ncbi:MAG: SMC-Scp complex subunit ScpB [Desulfuromonadales bacterium]|nr:SMC-Scp complex subunit ScpB [Desulfuromonadales bacterium]NIR34181.1 SMC-Scp complex subunit ScpB [Desulfuromonadales bacterium]NIS41628.1 SMC-Scp complex subunit ScpB [Desulfuromonadales bacterium]
MPLDTTELKRVLESLLFVSDVPLKAERLAEVTGQDKKAVREALEMIGDDLDSPDRGVRLQEVADGFQLRTPAESAEWIRLLHNTRPFRFSQAALESLAIIAYRQPITRAEIDYLRGVDSGGVVKTLLDKKLIRILGKKDVPGKPLIYGTSKEFLEVFGLRDLSALPTLKEFSDLALEDEEAALDQQDLGFGESSEESEASE